MKNTNKITKERLKLVFNTLSYNIINQFWIRTLAPFQTNIIARDYDKRK